MRGAQAGRAALRPPSSLQPRGPPSDGWAVSLAGPPAWPSPLPRHQPCSPGSETAEPPPDSALSTRSSFSWRPVSSGISVRPWPTEVGFSSLAELARELVRCRLSSQPRGRRMGGTWSGCGDCSPAPGTLGLPSCALVLPFPGFLDFWWVLFLQPIPCGLLFFRPALKSLQGPSLAPFLLVTVSLGDRIHCLSLSSACP